MRTVGKTFETINYNLVLPSWWISWFKDYKAQKRTIEEIYEIKGKYATLEFLIKGMTAV